ncbi:MAG: hypothetical protein LBO65_05465, partial [Spirochaetaceae bacterium]|nr:hypothetical protein [Spirochaetaceae bacterium]
YAPAFPAGGYFFDTYDSAAYPLGVLGRVSIVPIKRLWGWIGLELSPQYTSLKTRSGKYNLTGQMLGLYANGLFQKWMRDYTLAVNLRLGGGINSILGMEFDHRDGSHSKKTSTLLMTVNAGASVQWFVWKSLFIEGGVEYVQLISLQGDPSGFIRAAASLGIRLPWE